MGREQQSEPTDGVTRDKTRDNTRDNMRSLRPMRTQRAQPPLIEHCRGSLSVHVSRRRARRPCPPAADACRSLEPACGEASRGLEPLEGGSRYCRGSQRTGPGRVLSRRHYIVIVAGGGGGCWPGLAFYAAAAGRSRSVRMGPSLVLPRSLRRARVMSEGLNRDGGPQPSGEAGPAWPLGSSARCAGPDS
jgi:hypothetical protein